MSASPLSRAARWGAITLGGATVAGLAVGATVAGVSYGLWRRSRGYSLRGRCALVTGASRGLGFAIARELMRQGCRVAICARDRSEIDRAAAKLAAWGEVLPLSFDLMRPEAAAEAVAAVREQWGAIEVLVHNAGAIELGPWQEMSDEDFHHAMGIHCYAALRLARAVLPDMIAARQGRIVNISSIGGLVAVPHMLPYTASKFALVGLSQGLAAEVRQHGVRVTCVCPFLTRTGSQEKITVRGRHEKEFAWFAASGNMPLLTQSAPAAARAVVRACEAGTPQVVLTLPGKLAALGHGLAPSLSVAALGLMARMLPAPASPVPAEARTGRDSYSPLMARTLKPQIRRVGRELNQ